jgi:hypothetical protein
VNFAQSTLTTSMTMLDQLLESDSRENALRRMAVGLIRCKVIPHLKRPLAFDDRGCIEAFAEVDPLGFGIIEDRRCYLAKLVRLQLPENVKRAAARARQFDHLWGYQVERQLLY